MTQFIFTFCFLLTIEIFSGQDQLSIKVVDEWGEVAARVSVYLQNGNSHLIGLTDDHGKVEFSISETPGLVYLFDRRSNPVYGVKCYEFNMSCHEYLIEIPFFPRNEKNTAMQLDDFINTLSTAYGYYSPIDFAVKVLDKKLTLPGLGVPGLFNVNPVPRFDSDNKLGWEISGILFEKIINSYMHLQGRLYGFQFNYYSNVY